MRDHYDFSKSVRNPYARKLKKQISIRLETDVIDYFKALAKEEGVPYQTLINSYLKDCTKSKRKPSLKWTDV